MKNYLIGVAALFIATVLIVFSLAPNIVTADEYGQSGRQSWGDSEKTTERLPMGKHSMVATVETIDHKTGFLKLKTGMGEMTIHFPAPTVKDLNEGDEISVTLSYTKDEGKSSGGMMKMK
jgi:hypothetical protein